MEENQKGQLIQKLQNENSQLSLKEIPEWFPDDLIEKYEESDLTYQYFLMKIDEIAAAKRDTIPAETRRVWFKEFIRLGWSKYKFDTQYNALISTEISGHAIRIDNWINAKQELTPETHKPYEPETFYRNQTEEGKSWKGMFKEIIDKIDSGELHTINKWI